MLTAADAKRLAIAAHDGFTRAIWPTHTPADGDLVFALATGSSGIVPDPDAAIDLCAAAGATVARAIARAVYAARPAADDPFPTWSERFGGGQLAGADAVTPSSAPAPRRTAGRAWPRWAGGSDRRCRRFVKPWSAPCCGVRR